ncbi:endonuclease/exonuclease/phosphatase family protein [Halobacteriovorax sp. HLS]|uniref:endonuclease/exonuclease/phosphatase family protein n=1 Tax=Halobacteriovorax sp. HLS TaxID=2234000 RepID=UPI000FDA1959|nr:endonuclease/exonuclease/phosphatase family protein [Halobacteriovorax sp. HLS]
MSKILLIVLANITACFATNFTISTQNLWHYTKSYESRLDSLIQNIDTEKAEIMTFQEAWKSIGGKSLFNVFIENEELNVHYYKTNNTIIMREGLAIASTYEQVGKKLAYTLPHSKKIFGKRIMIVSKIRLSNEKEIYVINVHFSPFEDRKHERVDQLNFVIDKIRNHFSDRPVLLTGDFNQDQDDEFYRPLYDLGFRESARKDQIGCTFCSENPLTDAPFNSKLDYIFYQEEFLKLENVRKTFTENPISDHFGLRAEFSFH